jgi:NTP pyrophosphatase (non-canonical NTP hydrolase)
MDGKLTRLVLDMLADERGRQDAKWGEQNHDPAYWLAILGEEFGEVCKAVCEGKQDEYREELVHVAAVAVSMIECDIRQQIVARKNTILNG